MTRMMDAKLRDDAGRLQGQAADPAYHVWVSANAGSGKTRVLTQRVLRLLLEDGGLSPRDIVALTFTTAVAREMAERLGREVAAWATLAEADLGAALAEVLGRAATAEQVVRARTLPGMLLAEPPFITTLHGFGQAVLQRFPHEAGVEAGFAVVEGAAQQRLLREALEVALTEADADTSTALDLLLETWSDRALEEMSALMLNAWPRLSLLLEREEGLAGVLARLRETLGTERDAAYPQVDAALLGAFASALENTPSADDKKSLARVRALLDAPTEAAWREAFLTDGGTPRLKQFATKAAVETLGARWEDILILQRAVAEAADHAKARKAYLLTLALLRWAAHVKGCYERLKGEAGLLDFADLIVKLKGLLTSADGAWVRFRLDRRIRHLLLDEGQDNSPVQHEIFNLLADEVLSGDGAEGARTVFAVGDLKQSIYRFQGAQPGLFAALGKRMETTAGEERYRVVNLLHSFRSAPAVLAAVDAVFADPARVEAVLGEKGVGWPGHVSVYPDAAGRVELWPLAEKEKAEPAEVDGWTPPGPKETPPSGAVAVARRVAADIRAKVEGKELLASSGRAVCYGDMLVLTQRNGTAAQVAAALKRAGLPVRLVGGGDEAPPLIADLAAWLRAMVSAEDRVALATVLKSPLVGWSDAQLLRLHGVAGDGNWFEAVGAVDAATAAWLAEGRKVLAATTPHDALAWLAETRQVVARYGAAENATVLGDLLACALGVVEPLALVALLEAETVELSPAAGGDAVRVMTVHKAKGLEAPVVYVVETTISCQQTSANDRLLWREDATGMPELVMLWPSAKDCPAALEVLEAEEMARRRSDSLRTLYVALTRARDQLVVAGWKGQADPFKADPAGVPVSWYGAVAGAAEGWDEVDGRRVLAGGTVIARVAAEAEVASLPRPDWWGAVAGEARQADISTPALRRGAVLHEVLLALAAGGQAAGAARAMALAPDWTEEARREVVDEAAGVAAALPQFFGPGSWGERAMAVDGGIGRADRVARVDGVWWVIDFKTEAEVPATVPAGYRRQLEGYRAALAEVAGGAPVRAGVVWTRTGELAEIRGPDCTLTAGRAAG